MFSVWLKLQFYCFFWYISHIKQICMRFIDFLQCIKRGKSELLRLTRVTFVPRLPYLKSQACIFLFFNLSLNLILFISFSWLGSSMIGLSIPPRFFSLSLVNVDHVVHYVNGDAISGFVTDHGEIFCSFLTKCLGIQLCFFVLQSRHD